MKALAFAAVVSLLSLIVSGCQTAAVDESGANPEIAQTTSKLADLHTKLGIGYLREGKLELAWKRLHKALDIDPDYSTANNAMALILERLGQPNKAEEHYQRAVAANPGDSSAQNNYGRFLCKHGRYEEGEERFLRALSNTLYQTPELVYTNAGLCAKSGGDAAKAEAYFRNALQIQPKIAIALVNMAELSFNNDNHLSSRAYLQRYLEVRNHSAQSLWLGIRIERELGDQNALSSYAMLLKAQYPDSGETQLLLESSGQ